MRCRDSSRGEGSSTHACCGFTVDQFLNMTGASRHLRNSLPIMDTLSFKLIHGARQVVERSFALRFIAIGAGLPCTMC